MTSDINIQGINKNKQINKAKKALTAALVYIIWV